MAGVAAVGRRRITTDMLIQLAGRVFNLALGVVVTLVIVRALGDDDFGRWATILAVTQIATYFGELGLEDVAVSRAAAEPGRTREWIGALVTTRLLTGLPVMVAAATVIALVGTNSDMVVAGLLLCLPLALGATAALRVVFRLRVRNDIPTAVATVQSIAWGAVVIVLAARGGGIVPFAIGLAAVTLVTNLTLAALALRTLRQRLKLRSPVIGELLRAGTWVGAAAILTTAYLKIDQVLVFELAGARDAGLYGAIYRVLDQAQVIPIVAITTLLPVLASAFKADRARGNALFERSLDYLILASLPLLAFTIPAAEPTTRLLFGSEFADAAPGLPVLMGAFVLTAASYVVDSVVIILRQQRRFAVNAGIALVVNVALNLALVPRYGFMAAAWITLVTQALVVALNYTMVASRLQLALSLGRPVRALASAAVMAALVWALEAAGAGIVALAAAAAVSYPALALALRAVTVREARDLLRREGEWQPAPEPAPAAE